MLKIKENIDLKVLEKFGFMLLEHSNRYETNYLKGKDVDCFFMVDIKTRELKLFICDYYEGYWNKVEQANELLFDLMQFGLLEKGELLK